MERATERCKRCQERRTEAETSREARRQRYIKWEMWGQSGCDICHPIDCQGWFSWSGSLGRCPLPPSWLRVHPFWSCALPGRGRPSPIDQSTVKAKSSCAPLLEPPNKLPRSGVETQPQREPVQRPSQAWLFFSDAPWDKIIPTS